MLSALFSENLGKAKFISLALILEFMFLSMMTVWLPVLLGVGVIYLLFRPETGWLARWRQARKFIQRRRQEDALKHLLHGEANQRGVTLESLAGALQISTGQVAGLVAEMEKGGMVSSTDGPLRLEPAGRELAVHVVRAHRLWESYLADQTGVGETQWHRQAEIQEHLLSPVQTEALAAKLGNPLRDPHGDDIPAAGGPLAADAGQTLNEAPAQKPLVITHLEDEPEIIYAQLAAVGLQPGMKIRVLEKNARQVRFQADGRERVLAPVLAANIFVRPLPEEEAAAWDEAETLAGLEPGRRVQVAGLAPACRGPERRRLLDLGFVPGTAVEVEMASPAGDPIAYRVRGTLIALRQRQAAMIRVSRLEAAPA